MGDRANLVLNQENGGKIYLYTHWAGSRLPQTLKNGLLRGKSRWTDEPYLSRILFNELTLGQERSTTGFGLSTYLTDNEYPLLVVDIKPQLIHLQTEEGKAVSPVRSFEDYCGLDLNDNPWEVLKNGN